MGGSQFQRLKHFFLERLALRTPLEEVTLMLSNGCYALGTSR
jgi:hypothetical protein